MAKSLTKVQKNARKKKVDSIVDTIICIVLLLALVIPLGYFLVLMGNVI